MDDVKDRIRAAVGKYLAKQEQKAAPKRKNDKPEKEVEKQVMAWLRAMGFDCDVVEGKAVFNASEGRYLRGQVIPGFSDVCGNDQLGHAVFIELKAPGQRTRLRDEQREFLMRKIQTNCFAIVTDTVVFLSIAYQKWLAIKEPDLRRAYLLSLMPKEKEMNERPLFDDVE